VFALGLGIALWAPWRAPAPEVRAVQFSIEPPAQMRFTNQYGAVAPSPDGRFVVFAALAANGSAPMLWLRPLDSRTGRALPATEGGNFPFWSPDSKSLVFRADGKLKRIEIAGGAPLTLGDAVEAPVTTTGTWSAEGVILFGGAAGLSRVSASGGGSTLLTKVDPSKGEAGHGYPQFLPDGNRFLYFVESTDPNIQGVYASSLDNPQQRQQVLRTAAKAVYVPPRAGQPGYLLWMQEQTLLAQRFDPGSLRLEGDPVSVAEDIGLNAGSPIRAAYWASDAGLLVYLSGVQEAKRHVIWMSRDGKQLGDAAIQDRIGPLRLSPDAQRMAFMRTDSSGSGRGNQDIWLFEFARGVLTRLTFDPGTDATPIWSPDGRQVAFGSDREGGVMQIYRKDAAGGPEERLTSGPNSKVVLDWSRDGRYLLYRENHPKTDWDLWALPLEGDRKPVALVQTVFRDDTGQFSPDGKWIAYNSNETGRPEVYVQAFPTPSGKWQVSDNGGADLKWRSDGKELYYETSEGSIMAAEIRTGPRGIESGTPRRLFSAAIQSVVLHSFDATADGQRFLLLMQPAGTQADSPLTVVLNWQAALRK
jgi:Tol biopolymer transport system component